ncbi:MAG: TIGR03936 family radical SAM-associated protein [Eubacteriales bacterium]
MRIRVKFTKAGPLKFIGHLDVMRYFQKALRRAEIPVALSEGFSPHMIMSFAQPLGVGKTSSGEYFDLDLAEGTDFSRDSFLEKLNDEMVPGISVVNAVEIPSDKKNKGMALVAAASYTISFRKGQITFPENFTKVSSNSSGVDDEPEKSEVSGADGVQIQFLSRQIEKYLAQDHILVTRKTKKSEEESDIRPWIYEMKACMLPAGWKTDHPQNVEAEAFGIELLVSAKSGYNLKPEILVKNFADFSGIGLAEYTVLVHRNDLYAEVDDDANGKHFVPLDKLY